MLEPMLIAELALLGTFTGFLAGALGIGGGMITVPFVTYILVHRGVNADLSVKMAIATSMAAIVFISLSNVRAQHKRGAIRWDIFRNISPGIIVGTLITSIGIFNFVKGQALAIFFGLFITYSATKMLLAKKPAASQTMPSPTRQGLAGVLIGMLSGLVGAGGAFISVPYMTARNVPIHNAIATSAAFGMPLAIFSAIGFIYSGWNAPDLPPGALGFVFLPALAVLAIASSLMAPLGVKASHRLPMLALKRLFACLLYALAAYMLWKGLSS
ncbi:MAG: sulfite exporter TauE/SafE family protein [Cytophagales bacterium]|nr:sulfite exporter TauE/SafE family protein [Cytophagales bacterium]